MFTCGNCSLDFSYNDFNNHRQELSKQLEELEVTSNNFQQIQTSKKTMPLLFKHTVMYANGIEIKLNKSIDQLRQSCQAKDSIELNLNQWNKKLTELIKELAQPSHITIQQDFIPSIHNVYVTISLSKCILFDKKSF